MKINNLAVTADLMVSTEYQDRFLAEYVQTKIRRTRLHNMIVRYEAGTLDFKPDCPLELLKKQEKAMNQYLYYLEVRAQIEDVDLKDAEMYLQRKEEQLVSDQTD